MRDGSISFSIKITAIIIKVTSLESPQFVQYNTDKCDVIKWARNKKLGLIYFGSGCTESELVCLLGGVLFYYMIVYIYAKLSSDWLEKNCLLR